MYRVAVTVGTVNGDLNLVAGGLVDYCVVLSFTRAEIRLCLVLLLRTHIRVFV